VLRLRRPVPFAHPPLTDTPERLEGISVAILAWRPILGALQGVAQCTSVPHQQFADGPKKVWLIPAG
jgi:hypothetical protein